MSRSQRRHTGLLLACAALAVLAGGCGGASRAAERPPPSTSSTTTTSTSPAVKPVHGTVTVLEIGDSLGVDLGWGMQWALHGDSKVTLVEDARGDTGLANTGYYDWPLALRTDLAASHPQILVVFLGANDDQDFFVGTRYVAFGSALWEREYGNRVAEMMDEATRAGARVLWVGMPIMRSATLSAAVMKVDAVYQREARGRPNVTYFSSWKLFSTRKGQFNGGDTDVAGAPSPLRDPDGVHLDLGGEDLLGAAVVKEMRELYKLP